jgi:hypothetical protein
MTFRQLRNVRGFFSDYYLGSVFGRTTGRGRRRQLSNRESDFAYARFRRLRERAEGRAADAADCRERFLRPLFRDVLGFHLGAGDDRVHQLFASAEDEAAGATPLLVAYCGGWHEDLDAGHAAAQPMRRVERAIAQTGVRHGFIATGERLRLVRAAGEGPRAAYLDVDLDGLTEEDDPESFAAFLLLFSERNFLPDANGARPIDEIERESREHAEKVSEDLKKAVFTAAESLVGGLMDDAMARGAIGSAQDQDERGLRLYRDAALVALYRILFILYAEARDPRLAEHQLYRDSYSAEGLVEDVVRDPSREWPGNRSSLWARLRGLFRIYDRGLPPITPWENIPPRGGDFFSAGTPEGRLLEDARLSDESVARLMLDLATTTPRQGVGRERVSFRELDVESLGSVYEGLLEYEPRVARGEVIEIRVQGRTFALSPVDVLRLCTEKSLSLAGPFELIAGTEAESLHPEGTPEEDDEDEEEEEEDETEEAEAAGEEEGHQPAVRRGASATLVRRLKPGEFHFVPGAARKGSGSFYTPRLLVKDLVRHAVGPFVEGRNAADIERLRVLDPACGSAHFLVEAMRFLGRALHRAYVEEHGHAGPPQFRSTTGQGWDDNWQASDEEARAANSEARAWCKRRIAERCLFGVDRNPTAVVLARVALWIESVAGDRPLTYFAHHVRTGNSLLGTWLDRLDRPPLPSLAADWDSEDQIGLFEQAAREEVEEAARLRGLIDESEVEALRAEGVEPESVEELAYKEGLRTQAEDRLETAKLLFSLRCASAFLPGIWRDWPLLSTLAAEPEKLLATAHAAPWWSGFDTLRESEAFFHWELEFPEVLVNPDRPGFDVVLGNPPWDKVLPSKLDFYGRQDVLVRAYRGNDLARRIGELQAERPRLEAEFDLYKERTTTAARLMRQGGDFTLAEARSAAAHEDVSKYFVDRAARLVADGGRAGLVVPSVVYNGDGCVGIRRFLLTAASIERFYGFENRRKVFPIDSRYKFVSLVFRKGSPTTGCFDAAFMRHDLAELEDEGHKPWTVRIARDEVERLSPETFALLEYRGPRDQEIVHRLYRSNVTFGSDQEDGWKTTLVSWRAHNGIYNTSEDHDLWTGPDTDTLYSPESILGRGDRSVEATIHAMRARGFWPVFEGKQVEQFLVGVKAVRWWLSTEQAQAKYGRRLDTGSMTVFRETASNTNERTCIAAVLPGQSVGSHKLTRVLLGNVEPEAAVTVLNSLVFDFGLRLRTAGTSVSFTYMRPMPVPPADVVNRLPRIPTRLAWECGLKHITDDRDVWPLLWDANRAVAEAYGLTPADFEHILGTFPGMARKRAAFVAYLRERLADWKTERG